MALPSVKPVTFCPEDFAFGTPRDLPDIHGGDGFAVLEGRARVLTQKGEDCTAGMLGAAHEMLRIALEHRIDLAVLMDMSAACGSQVISDGCRLVAARKYQQGPGVAAAADAQRLQGREPKGLSHTGASVPQARRQPSG